jgi:chloramphenicol-sensitive protein RarD
LVPVYWHLLNEVPSFQIIATASSGHRAGAGLAADQLAPGLVAEDRAQPRALPILLVSSLTIAFNWGLYIWAVNAGHVIETSLGYFINPLVNVLLGVLVLKERLRRLQWVAVAMAAVGVAWLTIDAAHRRGSRWAWPVRSACMACCASWFRSTGGRPGRGEHVPVPAGAGVRDLGRERPWRRVLPWLGLAQRPAADLRRRGHRRAADRLRLRREAHSAVAGRHPAVHRAEPAAAAGVFFFHEAFDTAKAIGFAAIWAGLVLFVGDNIRTMRAKR